jgi:tetratricopeptide (TPR) repeat protein
MAVSRRTVYLGRALCLLSPLILLVLAEGLLRLAGYGGYAPLFREFRSGPATALVVTERAGAASYFRHISDRLTPLNQSVFAHPAPSNTVRIVIAGGSAAKGFPHSSAFAASAFLEAMLEDVWPGRDVEVLNLGTTAVASYPALDMARQALRYDPDLIIVYSGNNEFYGTYGVLSSPWAALHPAVLRLERRLRSLGLLQAAEPLFRSETALHDKALMEIMLSAAGEASPLHRMVAAHVLQYNLVRFIGATKAAGVPVIVCTVPVNEKSLQPIGGAAQSIVPASVATLLAQGTNELRAAPRRAMGTLARAAGQAPNSAIAQYYLGRACLACGETNRARTAFGRAIELDPMPWRATPAIQAAIRAAVVDQDVPLCDLEHGFRAASPDECIGWELMDDHVHPSLEGQILIARLLVAAMTQCTGRVHVPAGRLAALKRNDEYLAAAGDNPYDRWFVASVMRNLCALPFFRSNNPAAFVRFDQRAEERAAALSPTLRVALLQSVGTPGQSIGCKPVSGYAAHALMREQRFEEAERMLDVALRSTPAYSSWNLEYTYFLLVTRQRLYGTFAAADMAMARAALARGAFILTNGFTGTGLTERYMARIHQLLGEHAAAIPLLRQAREQLQGLERAATDQALVVAYLATGSTNDALRVIDAGLRGDQRVVAVYFNMLQALKRGAATADQPPGAGDDQ